MEKIYWSKLIIKVSHMKSLGFPIVFLKIVLKLLTNKQKSKIFYQFVWYKKIEANNKIITLCMIVFFVKINHSKNYSPQTYHYFILKLYDELDPINLFHDS